MATVAVVPDTRDQRLKRIAVCVFSNISRKTSSSSVTSILQYSAKSCVNCWLAKVEARKPSGPCPSKTAIATLPSPNGKTTCTSCPVSFCAHGLRPRIIWLPTSSRKDLCSTEGGLWCWAKGEPRCSSLRGLGRSVPHATKGTQQEAELAPELLALWVSVVLASESLPVGSLLSSFFDPLTGGFLGSDEVPALLLLDCADGLDVL
mmetsp:Transcript_31353/g.57527  ORF Transcript_31353/g.57527 Transcript_31353/m.57527 type:complete len:205 (+) Transcript_31353:911-1525(+)